jgi:SMI1-KNR4 cell-wall
VTIIDFEPNTSASPLDTARVEHVESELRLRFPIGFAEFLRTNNGGRPIQKYFKFGLNEWVIEEFLCLATDYKTSPVGHSDIEVVWSQIEDRLTEKLCPFASLFGGDFVCFNSDEPGEPTVVIWNRELSEFGTPTFTKVAKSFDEFLSLLYP